MVLPLGHGDCRVTRKLYLRLAGARIQTCHQVNSEPNALQPNQNETANPPDEDADLDLDLDLPFRGIWDTSLAFLELGAVLALIILISWL